jgi:uncharacterized protein YdiU (UPF0061 family)
MARISDLVFTHRLVRELPGARMEPAPSRQTPGIFFAEVSTTPVSKPELLIWSPEAASLLELPACVGEAESKLAAEVFSGNRLLPGCSPYATRYGGHQFGNWAGQLGDGRAHTLGEVVNSRGESFEVQLKGAGPTPYSRSADGRAVLRSSLREFLCSEAMHHLGVPTSRALCCVLTGDEVIRDMFYDGNPRPEPGAITTRIAPTFLRLGHFEILAAREENELLGKLVATSIRLHFPELAEKHAVSEGSPVSDDLLVDWFEEISSCTADLMVDWQRVGFVHGVMNTDNLSILGITIDYGPYGWLDDYDPEWTPNTTDAERRRYRFGHQPSIALWNLSRFGSALLPLASDSQAIIPRFEQVLERYRQRFGSRYLAMRARKIGFQIEENAEVPEPIRILLHQLDDLLVAVETDMTLFYRLLSQSMTVSPQDSRGWLATFSDCFYPEVLPSEVEAQWLTWLDQAIPLWQSDVGLNVALPQGAPSRLAARAQDMNTVNPFFTLRNYLVREALDELAEGRSDRMSALFAALKSPYEDTPITRPFFQKRPDWARSRAGCSSLSCSS